MVHGGGNWGGAQALILDVSGCANLTDAGVGALAGALPPRANVVALNFNGCPRVTDEGVRALAAGLPATATDVQVCAEGGGGSRLASLARDRDWRTRRGGDARTDVTSPRVIRTQELAARVITATAAVCEATLATPSSLPRCRNEQCGPRSSSSAARS